MDGGYGQKDHAWNFTVDGELDARSLKTPYQNTGDYLPVNIISSGQLVYPREAVVLQKGGIYDTIKKAVNAAGNSPIMVVPNHVVAASGGNFTTVALAIADAGVVAGDIILVKDGTYTETTTNVSKAVHIVGESREGTILQGSAIGGGLQFSAEASIANLTLDCDNAADSMINISSGLLYAYNVDGYTSAEGFQDTTYDIGIFELRHCRVFNQLYGAITSYSATFTLLLDNCYLENIGLPSNSGSIGELGDACVVTARRCTFAYIPVNAAADVPACVFNMQGSIQGTFDHCYFLEDLRAAVDLTGGEKTGLWASNASDDIKLIDCVASVLTPAGISLTNHLRQSAGTLRHVNTTVPTGQTLSVSAGVIPAYKIDPLAR